jgi:hypothetical protein
MSRRLLGNPEEEARAHPCLGPRGARPSLPNRRARERMKSPSADASARQHSGEPSPVLSRGGDRNSRARNPGIAEIEDEIAGLIDQSTHELRLAWRKLHRTGPPSRPQSRSDDPSSCQQAARAHPWRPEPRAAAPPADPGRRLGERRSVLRSWYRAEDRHHIGASVARTQRLGLLS